MSIAPRYEPPGTKLAADQYIELNRRFAMALAQFSDDERVITLRAQLEATARSAVSTSFEGFGVDLYPKTKEMSFVSNLYLLFLFIILVLMKK